MNNPNISVLGFPVDEHSSFLRGPGKAHQKILDAFYSERTNKFSENGIDLGSQNLWDNKGLVKLSTGEQGINTIRDSILAELQKGQRCISLGGDHSITFPIIQAHRRIFQPLNILHFDAHPDLYENFADDPFSHASPFARILENHLADRLVQVGIRTMNDHLRKQASRYNVEVISMSEFSADLKLKFDGPVYISIDMDGLDPAFAPGVSHPEPGGLSTREMITVIQNIKGNIIGGEIVEYNPDRDINDITAATAAKIFKELLGKMLI